MNIKFNIHSKNIVVIYYHKTSWLSLVKFNANLLIFPKRWNMATRTNAVLKSTKYEDIGKKIVEDPNLAIVPTTSDRKPIMKNMMSVNSISDVSQIT